MINDIDSLKSHIGQGLYEAEQEGVDREAVVELLERYAESVEDGRTTLPEDRGQWYQEVHGGAERRERVTAGD